MSTTQAKEQVEAVEVPAVGDSALWEFYSSPAFDFGYSSMCKMTLPSNLDGKTILDIGCRRGKGVFRLSERAGKAGLAIGIDWSPQFIAEAQSHMDRAWQKSGLPENNMEFHIAYPEDLSIAGIEDASVDAVFVNSVLNLAYHPQQCLNEMFRVLKPGGLLILETVTADASRETSVMEEARRLGNSVQSAPFEADLESMLAKAGFGEFVHVERTNVQPADGYADSNEARIVKTDEPVRFTATVIHATKAR